jgi:hypothetical protein
MTQDIVPKRSKGWNQLSIGETGHGVLACSTFQMYDSPLPPRKLWQWPQRSHSRICRYTVGVMILMTTMTQVGDTSATTQVNLTHHHEDRVCAAGADFPEVGGTIRTPAVATPATISDSHALTAAAPLKGAAADAAVPAPPESEHGPRSPRHAGRPQPQGAHTTRPQVSVFYKRLPQKSRDRLEEALIGWAAWHAAAYGDEAEDSHDSLVISITPVRQLSCATCTAQPLRCTI